MLIAQMTFAAQAGINLLLTLIVFGMSVWAAVVAASASPRAFVVSGKRTKGFWLVIVLLCLLVSLMGAWSAWVQFAFYASGAATRGPGVAGGLFQLVAAAAVGVFLADVRPVVRARRR